MKQTNRIKRLLSLALTAAVLLGVVLPVNGTEPELQALRFQKVDSGSVSAELRQDVAAEIQDEPEYADTDLVRVSIVLDQKSTLDEGFSTMDIAGNASAMSYRAALRSSQADVTAAIERATEEKLDVVKKRIAAAKAGRCLEPDPGGESHFRQRALWPDPGHPEPAWCERSCGGDAL